MIDRSHSSEMFRCLRDCDVEGIKKLWSHVAPNMPQPENGYQAAAQIHIARTGMEKMPVKLRLYSHCWLRDEGLIKASKLPDHLRPRAEREYPVGVRAVGIAVKPLSGAFTPYHLGIRSEMEYAVHETYADGHADQPQVVKARMLERRALFKKRV